MASVSTNNRREEQRDHWLDNSAQADRHEENSATKLEKLCFDSLGGTS